MVANITIKYEMYNDKIHNDEIYNDYFTGRYHKMGIELVKWKTEDYQIFFDLSSRTKVPKKSFKKQALLSKDS